VQCICLTMVSSRSWSKFKVKYCMTVLLVRSITLEKIMTLKNDLAQMMYHVIALVYDFTSLNKKY